MKTFLASPFGRIASLVTVLALCLLGAQAATVTATAGSTAAKAPAASRPVAQSRAGMLSSRIVGTTRDNRQVTGAFIPLHFAKRNGNVVVRGLVSGVVHERNGTRSTFAKMKTMRVKSLNGVSPRSAQATAARAGCRILRLVLGPLNLNLLGLRVHLNRVVLRIIAQPGPGNLLGNLLCAVANLLNQILGRLRHG
jgi:hypothetical protein